MPYKDPKAKSDYMREWQRRNRVRRNERVRELYTANLEESREKARIKQKAWAKANPEKVWKTKNRETNNAINRAKRGDRQRANERRYSATHRDKKAAMWAKRKASKLNATPSWADLETIKAKYKEARRVTEATGIRHHVDHIVPLKHEDVCGLHVEWNLQVIPAKENMSKGNRLTECGTLHDRDHNASRNALTSGIGLIHEMPARAA